MSSLPGNPHRKERLSTIDLFVLTGSDQLIFVMKILFTFVTKQAALLKRTTLLSLPLQLVFPDLTYPTPPATQVKQMRRLTPERHSSAKQQWLNH